MNSSMASPKAQFWAHFFFSMYTMSLRKVIEMHSEIKFHFYADDTQLFVQLCLNDASSMFQKLNSCLVDVQK